MRRVIETPDPNACLLERIRIGQSSVCSDCFSVQS